MSCRLQLASCFLVLAYVFPVWALAVESNQALEHNWREFFDTRTNRKRFMCAFQELKCRA